MKVTDEVLRSLKAWQIAEVSLQTRRHTKHATLMSSPFTICTQLNGLRSVMFMLFMHGFYVIHPHLKYMV